VTSGGAAAEEVAGMVGQALELLNGITFQVAPVPQTLLRQGQQNQANQANVPVRLPTVHEIAERVFVSGQYQANPPSPQAAYQQATAFVTERKKQVSQG
jgi:hypothetical protein